MIAHNGDILLAIQHLQLQMVSSTITSQNVYRHQDTCSPDTISEPHKRLQPQQQATRPILSQEAEINIECNRFANKMAQFAMECNELEIGPTIDTPLPGSRAGLQSNHGGPSRTTHLRLLQVKYRWSPSVMSSICWEVIGIAWR
jgi:hypothetical protein